MNLLVVPFVFFAFLWSPNCSSAALDAIKPTQTLLDNGETLVSVGEKFELGFFSRGKSKNRYVGIWYKNVPDTVIWVANRDNPLSNSSSGVLTITQTGNVVILSSNQSVIPTWSSNSSAKDPTLQLLITGNLVVKDGNSENYAWQSFDHPCDKLIAGMNLGWNLKSRWEWRLSSWNSSEDPSTGNFTYAVDPRGLAQLLQRRGSEIQYRSGPWDGARFGGDPPMQRNPIYDPMFVYNETHVYYTFRVYDDSTITMFWLNPEGRIKQLRWNYEHREWIEMFTLQRDECDRFEYCGPYGICSLTPAPFCHCPDGFEPKVREDWESYDWRSGCIPKTRLNCSAGEGFKKLSRVKLPYGSEFLVNETVVSKEDCRALCSRNCSCLAYTLGRVGGCLLWFDDLLDMVQYNDGGQDLYIRMAASELGMLMLISRHLF